MKKLFLTLFLLFSQLAYFQPAQATLTECKPGDGARWDYTGNGSTTAFPYTCRIIDQEDLKVIKVSTTGVAVTQTRGTHYTVSGVGSASGGNVTFTTAPATGERITILRLQKKHQQSNYVPGQAFPADSVEKDLDKIIMQIQQHDEILRRVPKLRDHETHFDVDLDDPGDTGVIPSSTLAKLPVSAAIGTVRRVTDGTSATDCVTGGGSTVVTYCEWNGTTWVFTGSSGSAPTGAEYIVGTANATLTAERVATDTATIDVDIATAGQAKFSIVAGSVGDSQVGTLSSSKISGDALTDNDFTAAEGFMRKTGAGAYTLHKSNLAAAVDPTSTDDNTLGYSIGSIWLNTTTANHCIATNVTTGAAVWFCAAISGTTNEINVTGQTISISNTPNFTAKVFQGGTPLVFEGTTVDANEVLLVITDPTADRTITQPDANTVLVQPVSSTATQFLTNVDASGVQQKAQPVFTDLSGAASDAQVPNLNALSTGLTVSRCVETDGAGNLSVAAAACNAAGTDTRQINFLISRDTALLDTDDFANFFANEMDATITITQIKAWTDTGTSTINIQRDDGTPANICTANLVASTAGVTCTLVAAEDELLDTESLDFVMVTAATTGTPTKITLVITISIPSTGGGGGGTGDVVGPASSTDNAIARFDGTDGKSIQNSGITVSDTNVISFPDGVRQTFNPDGTNAGLNVGSNAGDPSAGSNGDVVYNSTSGKFRCFQGGAWTDCIAAGSGGGGRTEDPISAGSMSVSGTITCDSPAENTPIANGPKLFTITNCADNDNASIEFDWQSPNETGHVWNAGTITIRLHALNTAATPSGILEIDWAGRCVTPGTDALAAHSTTGEQPTAITFTTQNREMSTTSAAITLNGTCAAGDHVYIRGQIDAPATTTTQFSNIHILGGMLDYTIN